MRAAVLHAREADGIYIEAPRRSLTRSVSIHNCFACFFLTCVSMSMLALLRPYVWHGTFLPVLPRSLHECLQSPVPYMLGLHAGGASLCQITHVNGFL